MTLSDSARLDAIRERLSRGCDCPTCQEARWLLEQVTALRERSSYPHDDAPEGEDWHHCGCAFDASGVQRIVCGRHARHAEVLALLREWQEARQPVTFEAPGVNVAATYQAAVQRMTAADVALAAYDLNGPASHAGGAA